MRHGGQTPLFLGGLAAMIALSAATQFARDRAFPQRANEADVLYVRSGETAQKAALSYDSLLADVYWIRALQHYGRERLSPPSEAKFDRLYPLLDMATTLDPWFVTGYRFGAIFLSEAHPGGAGRPDLAIELLKKGIARNPQKWDYYLDIGFIYYWHLHDYKQAAAWFTRGGELPGAPWWLRTYGAVMLTRGGDRQSSRAMWVQIGQSESEWLQKTAQLRLAQLDALDQLEVLQRASEDFAARTGQNARSWEQLVAAGVIRGIPIDPAGTPYLLDTPTGDVGLDPRSPLAPLPTEPAAAPEIGGSIPPPAPR